MMKRLLLGLGCVAMMMSASCSYYRAPVMPPMGLLYADIKAPMDIDVDRTELGTKVGRATSKSILGLFATDDASIAAAARNGGITEILHVDYEFKNVLMIFQEFTTVVYGN